MSLRLSRSPDGEMPVLTRSDRTLPRPHFRTTARPHRPADRSALATRGRLPRRPGQVVESSAAVRARVVAAAALQRVRQGKPNAQLQPKEIERLCRPDAQGETLLKNAFARLSLSARAYHRILKVARTIADLAAAKDLTASHVAEAIGYRRLDRMRA
jgi:predicted ATPase with chaperone activity